MAISRRYIAIMAFALVVCLQMWQSRAESKVGGKLAQVLTPEMIEEELQKCSIVQTLNLERSSSHAHDSPTWTKQLFAVLFPSSKPYINALLGTLYISGPPNFLLALCPPNIDPASLSIMVAFAVGGLLGDTLFHLLPEIFLGEGCEDKVKFVMVEPNRNLLLGVAIMVGFMTFVAMDKGLRIAMGGAAHDHGHGHSHGKKEETEAVTSSVDTANGKARNRKGGKEGNGSASTSAVIEKPSENVSHTGLLNLIADFTHNITDGLAMASSFYASPTLGATTTLAVFCHEIPHEVGDFALLIQSGFSKKSAMFAQFGTAVGALLGTIIGILIQEFGGGNKADGAIVGPGIWGTSLQWGDLLLPFTAGTFLYVGTVAVIPEMLETGKDKGAELKKTLTQFAAVATGAGIMLIISWS